MKCDFCFQDRRKPRRVEFVKMGEEPFVVLGREIKYICDYCLLAVQSGRPLIVENLPLDLRMNLDLELKIFGLIWGYGKENQIGVTPIFKMWCESDYFERWMN